MLKYTDGVMKKKILSLFDGYVVKTNEENEATFNFNT